MQVIVTGDALSLARALAAALPGTPLSIAVANGFVDVAATLIAFGEDVNEVVCADGPSPVLFAAQRMQWQCAQLLICANVNRDDVKNWTKDLTIDKTFSGLQLQLDILEMVSETGEFRLSTPDEESQGIDGYVDGEPVSIKPNTYKKTIQSGKESIPYRIIFYKNTKRGLVVS